MTAIALERVVAGIVHVSDTEFQRSLLDAINDASPDGILVVDGAGVIVSHNRRFLEIWQITTAGVGDTSHRVAVGLQDDPLLSEVSARLKDPAAFRARVEELYAHPELDDHCELALKDGRTLERHSTVLRGRSGQYLGRVWFFRDVTRWKEAQARLEALARHDSLTGVMNRRYFDERAAQEFARARRENRPVAIVEFDLDYFKRINDWFGHAAGDELLKAVCSACGAIVRQTSLFARIGGEEFAILVSGVPLTGVLVFAERLRTAASAASVQVAGERIAATISVGVAMRREDDATPEDCLRRADQAMYAAKQGGRNRVEVAY